MHCRMVLSLGGRVGSRSHGPSLSPAGERVMNAAESAEAWRPAELRGSLVVLRRHRQENLAQVIRWYRDPELARLTRYQTRPMSVEEIERFFSARLMTDDGIAYAIHERSTNRLIGLTTFSALDADNGSVLFHITIGEHDAWGRGYGTEATELMLQHAFERPRPPSRRPVRVRVQRSRPARVRESRLCPGGKVAPGDRARRPLVGRAPDGRAARGVAGHACGGRRPAPGARAPSRPWASGAVPSVGPGRRRLVTSSARSSSARVTRWTTRAMRPRGWRRLRSGRADLHAVRRPGAGGPGRGGRAGRRPAAGRQERGGVALHLARHRTDARRALARVRPRRPAPAPMTRGGRSCVHSSGDFGRMPRARPGARENDPAMSPLFGGPKITDEQKKRVPPGQYVTEKWPVLHYGSVPRTDLQTWNFRVWGEVENPFSSPGTSSSQMPRKTVHTDIHCVTRWSRLDMDWEGVPIQHVLDRAGLKPNGSLRACPLRAGLHRQPAAGRAR